MAAPIVHVENNQDSAADEFSDEDDYVSADSLPSGDDEELNDNEKDEEDTQTSGLGNVMTKILQKNIAEKCTVLAKGLTDRQIHKKRKTRTEESTADNKKIKTNDETESSSDDDVSSSSDEENESSTVKPDPFRVKPDPLNKDQERLMQRIATKGVVQLFNAVQKQQKLVDDKVKAPGLSESKKNKVLKTITKGGFMDMLKTNDKTKKVEGCSVDTEPSWKILREDFMMGAKLKDWDKESDDGGGSD